MSKVRLACNSFSPELQAIIAGLQGHEASTPEMDWDRVESLSIAHGVVPLLHESWRSMPAAAPATVVARFGRMRHDSAIRSAAGLIQRDQVAQILDGESLPYLVLKGAALARVWYGDLSLRPFADIDLLIPPGEIRRAR